MGLQVGGWDDEVFQGGGVHRVVVRLLPRQSCHLPECVGLAVELAPRLEVHPSSRCGYQEFRRLVGSGRFLLQGILPPMYGELRLLFSVVVDWDVAGSISVEDQSPRTSVDRGA